jgi:hypothetical protein
LNYVSLLDFFIIIFFCIFNLKSTILREVSVCPRAPKQYCYALQNFSWRWRISLYYPFLDHLITELELRLLTTQNHFHAQQLLLRAVDNITNDHVASFHYYFFLYFQLKIHNFERSFSLSSGPKAVLLRLAKFLLETLVHFWTKRITELESCLLITENRFHAQHLLPRAVVV